MYTLSEIAEMIDAQVLGDGTIEVSALTEPVTAGLGDLALAMSPRYGAALTASAAQAAVVWAGADIAALGLKGALVVDRPRRAMGLLTGAMLPEAHWTGIHETAYVYNSADVSPQASVGAFTVVNADAVIAGDSVVGDHVSVGEGVKIGSGCVIHAGVRLQPGVVICDNVVLHPNVVIGGDGFSFVTDAPSNAEVVRKTLGKSPLTAASDATQHKIHSLGGVIIGDDVEIGANSTVDAGTIRATQVGRGTKIDNLVQVGHNVIIGADCLLCAQTAVAGSAVIGDRVVLGGKSGVADNITIGADCVFGGGAIALADVPAGSFMMGYPAKPMLTFRSEQRHVRNAASR